MVLAPRANELAIRGSRSLEYITNFNYEIRFRSRPRRAPNLISLAAFERQILVAARRAQFMKATARQKHCQKGRGKFIVTEIRAGSGDNLMNEAQRLSVGFDSLMKLSVGHRWRAAVAFVYVGGSRVFINPFAAIRFH